MNKSGYVYDQPYLSLIVERDSALIDFPMCGSCLVVALHSVQAVAIHQKL